MTKIILPFLTIFTLLFMTGCKYESAAPIRNIRFDPKLLGRMQVEGPSACTNYFFFDKSTRRNLGVISSSYVLVAFDATLNSDGRQQVLDRFGFIEGIAGQTSSRSAMLYTLRLAEGLNCQQAGLVLKELAKDASVVYAAPYFVTYENGKEQLTGVSNELRVKASDAVALRNVSRSYNAATFTSLADQTVLLSLDKNSAGNALETANQLKNQQGIVMATPEFVSFTPGDAVIK